MNRHPVRPLLALAAVLLLAPAAAHAQRGRTLASFGSERELSAWLRRRAEAESAAAGGSSATTGSPPAPCTPAVVTRTPAHPGDTAAAAVVQGRILTSTLAPLAAATVTIDPSLRAATDTAGRFRIAVPAQRARAGGLSISLSRLGYTTQQHPLALAPGDVVETEFRLCASAINLGGLVATATGMANATSITNVQHEGVDEGDIVKLAGDYLVMLRRGRLFTVAVGSGQLRPVAAADAYGPGVDGSDAWYDELLVSGDQVVVIGYSYDRGGTEVGVFRLDPRGRLHHRATYHLRSDDYYSSRNYASRLIGTKLVLYMPLYLDVDDDFAAWRPALRRWHPGANDAEFRPIVDARRIYLPARETDTGGELALHTVVTCELARPEMQCTATAVVGPPGRVFYVSPSAVYVWVEEWDERRNTSERAMLYRMPLDGSAPSALGVEGSPADQFSFDETADGWLNVLVRSGGGGDAMWNPERTGGATALLRLRTDAFGDGRRSAPPGSYRRLPRPEGNGYAFHDRFVGGHLLYGSGGGWGRPARAGSVLHVVPVAGGRPAEVALPHGVDRIEVMGSDAVVVGSNGDDLYFSGIALAGAPRVARQFVTHGATQGEERSHGFFYRQDAPGEGLIGLPVGRPGRKGYEHLFEESAGVLFLRNDGAAFRELGELGAHPETAVDDGCVASCVDWYGNSRPLFVGDRIFALLGYEIVEGGLSGTRIRELRRVTFAPRQEQAAR